MSFSPTSRAVSVSGANVSGINFSAAYSTATYSISGTISGGAGATVNLTGAGGATTIADGSGNYTFSGLVNGTYTLTPSKSGYTFAPTSLTVTINGAAVSGVNFTATSTTMYAISGNISPLAGGAGATVTLGGAAAATTTTDGNGNYSFTGVANGNYTVTPSNSGYTFTPSTQNVTVNGANVTTVNFSAVATTTSWSISGTISPSSAGAGATVSLGGASTSSTTADANGNYSFTGLPNGSYTVTPLKNGYTFSPASANVAINGADVTGTNFSASATATQPPTFVQVNHNLISTGSVVSASFNNATSAGNTIVAYVIWNNAGTAAVSDSQGNSFRPASPALVSAGGSSAQVFYASGIVGGADTITASFSNSVTSYGIVYVHEYSGIDTTNPVDVTVSASGASSTLNSGAATTSTANDLVFGAGVSDSTVTSVGSGFTGRDTAYGNVTEDMVAGVPGSYSATAMHNGTYWGMQMVAFRPVATTGTGTGWSISGTLSPLAGGAGATVTLGGTQTATSTADANGNYTFGGLPDGSYTVTPSNSGYNFTPATANVTVNGANVTGINFTAGSTASSHSVDLSWTASTSASAAGYYIYRSTTNGGPYTVINTAPVTSTVYTDASVAAGSTYFYVVTAVDSSGNQSSYSNQATAVIPTP